jgi:hypothetical protein
VVGWKGLFSGYAAPGWRNNFRDMATRPYGSVNAATFERGSIEIALPEIPPFPSKLFSSKLVSFEARLPLFR